MTLRRVPKQEPLFPLNDCIIHIPYLFNSTYCLLFPLFFFYFVFVKLFFFVYLAPISL